MNEPYARPVLPDDYFHRMMHVFGPDFPAFWATYDAPPARALRINPRKVADPQRVLSRLPGIEEAVPWEPQARYYASDAAPGKHPLHDAGAFYIQEPSAMAPVPALDVRPGETVLDLCAAPGGKSTRIADALDGTGVLYANEIHPVRVKTLARNLERMGVGNAIVTNVAPSRYAERFPEAFDKVLVDAPCSGEGMMRRKPEAIREWSVEQIRLCATRQREILDRAAVCVRPGGRMVYATCTFAPEENEEQVAAFLERHPEFTLKEQRRLTPDRVRGDGQFYAVLDKAPGDPLAGSRRTAPYRQALTARHEAAYAKARGNTSHRAGQDAFAPLSREEEALFDAFCDEVLTGRERLPRGGVFRMGERVFLLPEGGTVPDGFPVERAGLEIGAFPKGRFQPAHALAQALMTRDVVNPLCLPADGAPAEAYLRGEALRDAALCTGDGFRVVFFDGVSAGWVRESRGVFKNHYPKGLRRC